MFLLLLPEYPIKLNHLGLNVRHYIRNDFNYLRTTSNFNLTTSYSDLCLFFLFLPVLIRSDCLPHQARDCNWINLLIAELSMEKRKWIYSLPFFSSLVSQIQCRKNTQPNTKVSLLAYNLINVSYGAANANRMLNDRHLDGKCIETLINNQSSLIAWYFDIDSNHGSQWCEWNSVEILCLWGCFFPIGFVQMKLV